VNLTLSLLYFQRVDVTSGRNGDRDVVGDDNVGVIVEDGELWRGDWAPIQAGISGRYFRQIALL